MEERGDQASKPYSKRPRPRRWSLLLAVAGLHVLFLYFLAHALLPEVSQSLEREVIAAFDVAERPPPPPANPSEPDQGAQAEAGREAVAAPVSAPPAVLPPPQTRPVPRTASTGSAAESGARAAGDGTGAEGTGLGTGSGNSGRGRGSGAVTRPEHISGSIDNARDYPTPPGGRGARRGTEVIVRVIVGVDGRARDCSIYRASSDPKADAITCSLVEERLGFRPARDADGNKVEAPFYWRQRWF